VLKFLKFLFYLVVTVAVIVVGGSFLLPAEAVVTRSAEIAAPPEKVFAIVGDLHRLPDYSPWAELDPNTKYTYEGPATGVGQKVSWMSDKADVGAGSQTITEYDAPRHAASELDFGPRGKAIAIWDLQPSGAGTKATWTLHSRLDGIVARWFGLALDGAVGPYFERGLAKVKAAAEKPDATTSG
jgi:uncharacterized protein YndB with AHSA1/START domain